MGSTGEPFKTSLFVFVFVFVVVFLYLYLRLHLDLDPLLDKFFFQVHVTRKLYSEDRAGGAALCEGDGPSTQEKSLTRKQSFDLNPAWRFWGQNIN